MSVPLAARIRFLRDCYEADNRESAVWDLSADKIRHLNIPLMGGQFLCGAIDRIPIEREAALAAQAELSLNRAEKSLVLGAFVRAKVEQARINTRVLAWWFAVLVLDHQ